MGELIGQIPAVAAIVEKGGVVGLLILVCGVLGYEVYRLRKENRVVYAKLDRYRLGFALCKAECDRGGLKPDLSMLNDLLDDAGKPA